MLNPKTKDFSHHKKRIDNFLEWFNNQSLTVFVSLGIFLLSFVMKIMDVFHVGIPKDVNHLQYIWHSFNSDVRVSVVIQAALVLAIIALWIIARVSTKRDNSTKIKKCLETMENICASSGESYRTYKELSKEIRSLRETTDDNLVKHILEPSICKLDDIEKVVDSSYDRIRKCGEIAKECSDISELLQHQHEAEKSKNIVSESNNTLNYIFELVKNATMNIRKPYLEIVGCYIMCNDNIKKILKISQNKDDNNFTALVHDGGGYHRFEIIFATIDEIKGVARLILSCSEHSNVEQYSCDVDLAVKHDRAHRCTYIRNNKHETEKYCISFLDEQLMGHGRLTLSDTPITEDNFDEIVSKAMIKKKYLLEMH